MNPYYTIAFKLLGVGMLTVFLILFLVVIIGNLLIKVVNRYFPESDRESTKRSAGPTQDTGIIDKKKMAVISAAVSHITGGRGKISRIESIK